MKHRFFILCYFLLSSCVTSVELHKKSPGNPSSTTTEKKWEQTAPSFLFGFISPAKDIKAWEKCPTDWHTIKITRSFLHVVISILTIGIYTPLKVIIICEAQEPSNIFEEDF